MKRLGLIILILLLVTGCGKNSSSNSLKEINKMFDKSSGYKLIGNLEINNNDESYSYDVVVDYKKDNFYKVVLTNTSNNFMQIILKNNDGVFLLTPSLNKSFKFQSDWPYNNSQIYLFDTIINDLNNDTERKYTNNKDSFSYVVGAHYSNNSKLVKQKILFDKKYNLKKVTIYDNDDSICMVLNVSKIKFSPKYNDDYFELDSIISTNEERTTNKNSESSVLEDVIYPLFLPDGTKLTREEKVYKDAGERVIMTYDGEKNFLLVEETVDVFNDFTVIPSLGEPFQLLDTIGVMTDNSLSWSSGNIDYYLVSDVMSQEELVDVAQSIVGVISMK